MCMFGCGMPASESLEKKADAPAGVQVLHEQKLGGFDVSVLEADNAEALANGSRTTAIPPTRSSMIGSSRTSPANGRSARSRSRRIPKSGQLATTKAVAMSLTRPIGRSFRTASRKPGRTTRIPGARAGDLLAFFFVGDTRMEGKLGVTALARGDSVGRLFTDEQRVQLAKETGVSAEEIPEGVGDDL